MRKNTNSQWLKRALATMMTLILLLSSVQIFAFEANEIQEFNSPADIVTVYNGWNPAELQEMLNNGNVSLATNGLGIFGSFSVPEGRTLYIDNERFVIHGTLIIEGVLVNNGQVHNQYGGTIIVGSTGRIVNNGFLQNNTLGVIYINQPGLIAGNPVSGAGRVNVAADPLESAATLARQVAEAHFDANRPTAFTNLADWAARANQIGSGIVAAVNTAFADPDNEVLGAAAEWITDINGFTGERNTVVDPAIMAGTLRVTLGSRTAYVSLFFDNILPPITVTEPEWFTNRRVIQYDSEGNPIFRDDLEKDIYYLVAVHGPRLWGSENERRAAEYVVSRFNEAIQAGGAYATGAVAEVLKIDYRNLHPEIWQREEEPTIGAFEFSGGLNDFYGLAMPLDINMSFPDIDFAAEDAPTVVDLGTFPNFDAPGVTGDIVAFIRFESAHLQMETQLLPALKAYENEHDVNIVLFALARHWPERLMWNGQVVQLEVRPTDVSGNRHVEYGMHPALPGFEAVVDAGYPFILVAYYNMVDILERAAEGNLSRIRRQERFILHSPFMRLPASNDPDNPDLVILLGAHFDSTASSPGVSDNAGSSAAIIEAARELANIDRGGIEFWILPYSGHEAGMNAGSEAFFPGGGGGPSLVLQTVFRKFADEGFADIGLMYSFDMITSPGPAQRANNFMPNFNVGGHWPAWRTPVAQLPQFASTFNLAAYLLTDTAHSFYTKNPDLWAPGTTNINATGRGGSGEATHAVRDHGIMSSGGSKGLEIAYHNTRDDLEHNYCYDRLRFAADIVTQGMLRAVEDAVTRRAEFIIDLDSGVLRLVNASQLYSTYNSVEGMLLIEGVEDIQFVIAYPGDSFEFTPVQGSPAAGIRNLFAFGEDNSAVFRIDHPGTVGGTISNVTRGRVYAGLVSNLAPSPELLRSRISDITLNTSWVGSSQGYPVRDSLIIENGVPYISNRAFADLIGGTQRYTTYSMNGVAFRGLTLVSGYNVAGEYVSIRVEGWRQQTLPATYPGWWTVDVPAPVTATITVDGAVTYNNVNIGEFAGLMNTNLGVVERHVSAYLPLHFLAKAFGFEVEHLGGGDYRLYFEAEHVPALTYTLFAEDWRESINLRFFLDDAPVEIPLEDMELVVDGVSVENIRDFTLNIADWQTAHHTVFICKLRHNWEHLTFTVTAHGQSLFFEFTNSMFVPTDSMPVLTTTIFDEDWRESINIRFFLDGVLSEIPIENIVLIADGEVVENIRYFTLNIAGWQTSTSAIFISKDKTPWHEMTIHITAYGQTLTFIYVNSWY